MNWGTEAQKHRFLTPMLSGEETWCRGYSEPSAGSDLASLQTRAVDQGDFFTLNGGKIWTSGAQYADWMYVLARTDPKAPKHKGISCFYLDMKSPGVEVRPLITMAGHRHFNQVFFDNVRLPKENLVGPLNEGWRVAMATLMFERAISGGSGHCTCKSSGSLNWRVRSPSMGNRRGSMNGSAKNSHSFRSSAKPSSTPRCVR